MYMKFDLNANAKKPMTKVAQKILTFVKYYCAIVYCVALAFIVFSSYNVKIQKNDSLVAVKAIAEKAIKENYPGEKVDQVWIYQDFVPGNGEYYYALTTKKHNGTIKIAYNDSTEMNYLVSVQKGERHEIN